MSYTITPDDIIAFTEGDCWALAREISKRTGWRAYALGAYRVDKLASRAVRDYPLADFDWAHVVVQTPDGRYLDVTGFVTLAALTATYLSHIKTYFGWDAEALVFEPVIGEVAWAALTGTPKREYPAAPVGKVAASLVRHYHASRQQRSS